MKNNLLKGVIWGFVFTLLINSICCVSYYGLEYGIALSIDVFAINLAFMIVSTLIVFILKKCKINNKMALLSNVLLAIFGILMFVNIFNDNLTKIIASNMVIPGPTVKIPNFVWLIVLLCVAITNNKSDDNQKYSLLKFLIGEIISVVILVIIDVILSNCIHTFNNAFDVNKMINGVIQAVCCIGIVGFAIYNGINSIFNSQSRIVSEKN